jgi:hypothetical protein
VVTLRAGSLDFRPIVGASDESVISVSKSSRGNAARFGLTMAGPLATGLGDMARPLTGLRVSLTLPGMGERCGDFGVGPRTPSELVGPSFSCGSIAIVSETASRF